MTPRPPGAALVSVLGAQPPLRLSLIRSLQARLQARGAAALHLPCPPLARPADSDWPQGQAQALNAALAHEALVLSESSTLHAVAALPFAQPPELQAAARAELARCTLVLLCAPSAQAQAQVHAIDGRLRELLLASHASFSVIHSTGPTAHAQAWQTLCLALGWPADAEPTLGAGRAARWQHPCDTCSDPGCEHRLFSDLLTQRAPT